MAAFWAAAVVVAAAEEEEEEEDGLVAVAEGAAEAAVPVAWVEEVAEPTLAEVVAGAEPTLAVAVAAGPAGQHPISGAPRVSEPVPAAPAVPVEPVEPAVPASARGGPGRVPDLASLQEVAPVSLRVAAADLTLDHDRAQGIDRRLAARARVVIAHKSAVDPVIFAPEREAAPAPATALDWLTAPALGRESATGPERCRASAIDPSPGIVCRPREPA